MHGSFNFITLFFLILAVIIFIKLRNVLGTRTGDEQPPQPIFKRKSQEGQNDNAKVVAFPGTKVEDATVIDVTPPKEKNEAVNEALRSVLSADKNFNQEQFLGGARAAYGMVVTAFADADRQTLQQLLSPDVFEGFAAALDEREAKQEKVTSTLVGINKADIIETAVEGRVAHITVRFLTEMVTATYNADGHVVDGDPVKVIKVNDVWTFARDLSSRDPNWRLIATESGE